MEATISAARGSANLREQRVRRLKALLFAVCLLPIVREAYLVLSGAEVNPIEFVIRSTGLWALVWLWATLFISPLKKLTGWGSLLRFRRELGLFSFFYACLHLVCYLWLDKFFDWADVYKDVIGRPFITIGTVAVVLMLPLAVTSTDGWVRRLKRNWSRLHWLVYPAAALSVWHYFLEVKRDTTQPWIYAVVLGLLLGWRVYERGIRPWLARRMSPVR
ncbi:sulfite oxidase heme-binding subunit YedZ [Crenobacter cavernae]|uniref:Protein-methionine-sulfoxide reductase heme-binding subunit MsrQ n=1 Tax=Crenobacter cavernae TaxID=2290923 RepID=A0A345Y5Q6_9NEIS|nr:protein-methionine-sulfoxide reductase heme-binding subunit MsrQ [Crenobacter cavernae]AXK39258.1 sulfoxide reductase heme-binding subunit YedZ [Crenobacter cavernae]